MQLPQSSYIGTRQEFSLGFNGVGINASSSAADYIEQYGNDTGQGFFFGNDSDEYYKEQDLTFVEEALELIEAGYKIEYSSWW